MFPSLGNQPGEIKLLYVFANSRGLPVPRFKSGSGCTSSWNRSLEETDLLRDGAGRGGGGEGSAEVQKEDPVTGGQPGLMTMLINIFEASATRPRRHETARVD